MKSIADELIETIEVEEERNSSDKNFREFDQLLIQLDKVRYREKPEYSLPLIDTIGRTTYSALNKHFYKVL